MLARVKTSTLFGVEAIPIEVEVEVRGGTPKFTIIGLGDGAIREAKDRVTSAIRASGFKMPGGPILVNLAPAEVRKEGSSFDISIALGILAASCQLDPSLIEKVSVHGELSLDGSIKGVRGILPMALSAKTLGTNKICVPASNVAEASLISGLEIIGSSSLIELFAILNGDLAPTIMEEDDKEITSKQFGLFSEVWGQERAKRSLMIAAAGGHNALMIGPPGCGKSMLAQAFQSILPPLNDDELLQVIKIHSAAGLPVQGSIKRERPYRAPHHVISDVGLVGGGSIPRPGEISLAHRGVLFLDEFPEYRRSALEALRAPLENGKVRIVRASGSVEFPAQFQLIAAMNPCPCGRLGVSGVNCLCSMTAIQQYLKKLSQPILDRIDLHVELDPVPLSVMLNPDNLNDKDLRVQDQLIIDSVSKAREIQFKRQGRLNSELTGKEISTMVPISNSQEKLLSKAAQKIGLSARSYVRILKVARTIADFKEQETVLLEDLAEAIGYRALERLNQYCTQ